MKLSPFFVKKFRPSGEPFRSLADHAPDWLKAAIYEAHRGSFPCDWVYEECYSAACAIDDGSLSTDEDTVHEHADSQVDVYTARLYRWQADFCTSDLYADAESEFQDAGAGADEEKRVAIPNTTPLRRSPGP